MNDKQRMSKKHKQESGKPLGGGVLEKATVGYMQLGGVQIQ